MRRRLFAVVCIALVLTSAHSWAATAHLGATEVLEYESVELVLRSSQDTTPDLSGLDEDFEILNRSNQISRQRVNGVVQVLDNIVTLQLRPKRAGVIPVPAIPFGDERTQPLELLVRPINETIQQEIDQMAFYEVKASNLQPLQGEAVFITRSLHYASGAQIYGGLPGSPEVAGATVQPVGEPVSGNRRVNGRILGVIDSEYVLFADQPGSLLIPEAEVMVRMQIPSFARGRPTGIPVRSPEIMLEVRPPPNAYPANKPWLAARELSITSGFDSTIAKVGEPLTFEVLIVAESALASQIAPLNLVFPSSIKSYAESPRLEDQRQSGSIRGQRLERYSLVPTQTGIFTLPEVRMTWWDTSEERVRESRLAARKIEILPDPEAMSGSDAAQVRSFEADSPESARVENALGTERDSLFDWLDLVLFLLCLALGVGWLRSSRQGQVWVSRMHSKRSTRSAEETAFDRLMHGEDLAAALVAFRDWQAHLPLEHKTEHETLLKSAEASLYAAHAPTTDAPSASTLREAAREARKRWLEESNRRHSRTLPGLYRHSTQAG